VADQANELRLLSAFRFTVAISGESVSLGAAFSAVSGLEVNVESVELREGGYNVGVRRLVGKASSPPLVLKRGVSTDRGFWAWVTRCTSGAPAYVNGEITEHSAAPGTPGAIEARWEFHRGVVTKVSGPELDALEGGVPIEELHIAHEGLFRRQ
jgi:phage tail-like protein